MKRRRSRSDSQTIASISPRICASRSREASASACRLLACELEPLRLSGSPLADVADNGDHELVAVGEHGAEADLDRELTPVLPHAVQVETRAHLSRPRVDGIAAAMLDVAPAEPLGNEQVDALADELTRLVSEQLRRPPVYERDCALRVDEENRIRRRLEQRTEARLRRTSLGYVADDRDDECLLRVLEGAQADLDGKFAAVLPQSVELEVRPHLPRSRVARIVGAMSEVAGAEALGHEQLYLTAQQFIPRVSEQLLNATIDERDPPARVREHDCVGRRFQQRAEERFGRLCVHVRQKLGRQTAPAG